MNSNDFQFGVWLASPSRNILTSIDSKVQKQMEPKTMDVLVQLAENQGEVVSRQRFQETVWQGRLVVDEGLTRCISELRRALSDDPKKPEYIETLSKRGYRFLQPVTWLDQQTDSSSSVASYKLPRRFLKMSAALVLTTALILLSFYLFNSYKKDYVEIELASPEDLYEVFFNSTAHKLVASWTPPKNPEGIVILRAQKLVDGSTQRISMRLFDQFNVRLLDTVLPFGSESERHDAIANMISSLELLESRYSNPSILKLPAHLRLNYQQASLMTTEGDVAELELAVEKFDDILLEHPNFVDALIGKILALRGIAIYAPIEERSKYVNLNNLLLQRIKIIDPVHPYLVSTEYRPKKGDVNWDEYEQVLKDSVNALPSCFECVNKLAKFYTNVGWRRKAISLHQNHLAYYPTSSRAHAELAMLYSRAGDIKGMKTHVDLVRLMDNPRWVMPSEVNYYHAIGDSEAWVSHWEQFNQRSGYDQASHDSAAAIAAGDIEKLNSLMDQMARISFNLALSAGRIEEVIERIETNLDKGQYFDLSLIHGWQHHSNVLTKYYIKGRSELQNHPRITKIFSELGLMTFWKDRNQWPDDCSLNSSPRFCEVELAVGTSET